MVVSNEKEPPTVTQEAKHYCNYIGRRIRGFQDLLLPPPPARLTASEAFVEQRRDEKLFYDDVDSEDEDWVDVGDVSREVPQENDQEVTRLAKEGGPIQQTALKLQEKAIEGAFEAAGVTGQQLVFFMKCIAEDSGWLSNCNTVDELVNGLLGKYPLLKGAGAVLKELKSSFFQGRKTAEKERTRALTSPAAPEQVKKQQQPLTASKIRREDFAAYKEVPLDETDLECEGQVLER
ncbi:hypothetical protein LTR85_003187 [Meristemomyces frigidus]|nr:hypothetical protein LTR85_003187 [Meristemomyces frigidus]